MAKIIPFFAKKFDSPTLKLAAVFTVSLAMYILAFIRPANLLSLYLAVHLDGHLMHDGGLSAYLRMVLAFGGVAFLYFWGLRLAARTKSKAAWAIVISGTLVFVLVFLFMAPFDALDIYDNIFHGRITGIYGGNPFSQVIASFPRDPFFVYTPWKSSPTAYGPVWEMLAGLTARLAGDGILQNILAFKLLAGIFQLVGIAVLVVFFRKTAPERALPAALLLGWNPVILYETWGNGHNDFAMAFWVLLAAILISRQRYTWGTLSLVVGALVKFIPILLIPAALLIAVFNLHNLRSRLWFLAKTSVAALALLVAAYLPFWNGLATLNISRRMQLFTTSIPSVIYQFLNPIVGLSLSARLVSLGALGVLAVFTLYQSFKVKNQEPSHDFSSIAFNILAFYLMVACLWFQQWYCLWLIALAPLLPVCSRRLALFFGFWVLTKQFVFGPLIVPLMVRYPNKAIWLEPILTISVFGVLWVFAIRNSIQRRSMDMKSLK
jgi:fumarate reductase subunit D